MGIALNYAGLLCREHAYRPFTGRVFVVGRQTMFFSPEQAIELAKSCGINVRGIDPATLEIDEDTRASAGNRYIRDDAFFRLLGVRKLESIDVSDYEGASVIHDLNEPVPAQLEGIADVIVDGSTLDNVFAPATALRNMARMLKPGGRLISFVLGSNHYCPYIILTPLWLYDYFVVNRFTDCHVYVVVYEDGGTKVLRVNPETMSGGPLWTPNIETHSVVGLVTVAEKGAASTWNKSPVQHQYRSAEKAAEYAHLPRTNNPRPDLLWSTNVHAVPSGYRLVRPEDATSTQPVR